MELTYQQDNGRGRIVVSGEMTVSYMADNKAALLSYVRSNPYLKMDLMHVNQIDTAGVQMIILLKKESRALTHTLLLTGHSQPVKEMIGLLHLHMLFDLNESAQ